MSEKKVIHSEMESIFDIWEYVEIESIKGNY